MSSEWFSEYGCARTSISWELDGIINSPPTDPETLGGAQPYHDSDVL